MTNGIRGQDGRCRYCGAPASESHAPDCKTLLLEPVTEAVTKAIRIDLLPPEGLAAAGRVMDGGRSKHTIGSWRSLPPEDQLAKVFRHINRWQRGEFVDQESGQSHLAHAAVRLLMLCEMELRGQTNAMKYQMSGKLLPVESRFYPQGSESIETCDWRYTHPGPERKESACSFPKGHEGPHSFESEPGYKS